MYVEVKSGGSSLPQGASAIPIGSQFSANGKQYINTGTGVDLATGASVQGYQFPQGGGFNPVVVSSAQGADYVNKSTETLNKLQGSVYTQPQQPQETKPSTPVLGGESSITYINPNTDQTYKLDSKSITPDVVQELKNKGFSVMESSGNIPQWAVMSNPELGKAQNELDTARSDFDALKQQLTQFTISDDEIKAQVDAIASQWDSRIYEMGQINARRDASMNTLGIRLGSQYTGGQGGVFGGIMAEEERQGVQRISELEANKQAAISAAKEAARTKNWQVYGELVGLAEKAYQEKLSAVTELNKTVLENNKKIQESMIQSSRDSAIADLINQGVTDPTELIDYLNFYEDGKPTGGDFTMKEITGVIDSIKKATKSDNLPSDINEWRILLDMGPEQGGLPQGTTFLQYQQMKKKAVQKEQTQKEVSPLSNVQYQRLETVGVSKDLANQLTAAILSGATLEDIRSALQQDNVDPSTLDKYDNVVGIESLLKTKNTASQKEQTIPPSVVGNVRALKSNDAPLQDIQNYVEFSGYNFDSPQIQKELNGYNK